MKCLLSLILLLVGSKATGQQFICGSSIPLTEKEYYYKIDALPDKYDLGSSGDNNLWLFTSLKGPRSLKYESLIAGKGRYSDYFPNSELVFVAPNGKETYLQNLNDSWRQLGFVIKEENSIEPKVVQFNPPLKSCTPQVENVTSRHGTTASGSPAIGFSYDDVKDASGVLYLPDGIYDVLRTTRRITRSSSGVISVNTEMYFEDEMTGIIVMVVEMSEGGAISKIRYMSKEDENEIRGSSDSREFLLYPNTGYGEVRLEFTNFTPGKYNLVVYDIVGRELWRKQFDIVNDITLKEDLSFLPRGTYPYTILDENQNRILTRRLAIIKS